MNPKKIPKSLLERDLDEYIDDSGKCWEWLGKRNRTGYGIVIHSDSRYLAHRVMWAQENGQIPDGYLICHKCDNPACVRFSHLLLGTTQDNTFDMKRKGRAPSMYGELNGKHVLRVSDVIKIRKMVASGIQQKQIAATYRVHPSTISYAVRGINWRRIA